jgi:hypothetical protein
MVTLLVELQAVTNRKKEANRMGYRDCFMASPFCNDMNWGNSSA